MEIFGRIMFKTHVSEASAKDCICQKQAAYSSLAVVPLELKEGTVASGVEW